MKRILKLIILFTIFYFFNKNVYAYNKDDVMKLNPEWIKYMRLPEEDKLLYEAIPEQYIFEYKYENKIKFNTYNNHFYSLDGEDELPAYFTLANVDGKRYVNSKKKDQGRLGLCWAFGAIGSAESNILLNGVKGLDEEIAKCDENNNTSVACSYKNDQIINDNYINNSVSLEKNNTIIENATFSERVIDYLRTKPSDATTYHDNTGVKVITEGYNPYTTNGVFGSGGYFSLVAKYYNYGITPIRTQNEWESYNTAYSEKSLAQVFDSVDSIYQVTSHYTFPSEPTDAIQKEEWIKKLKKAIMEYGSVYVSTVAPQQSSGRSCYYYDTKYTIDGVKQYIRLINYEGNCGSGSLGWHAMQIVGWDDNYEFAYCKEDNYAKDTYTETSCIEAGYTWTQGKGAWILKNSWGNSSLYPYLSYQSIGLSINGVREVSVKNFDNSYNEKNSKITSTRRTVKIDDKSVSEYTYKFNKTDNLEYLTRFNIVASNYDLDIAVSISNDGENYKPIDTKYIDYPGLYTFDVDNYEVNDKNFYIRVTGSSISSINAFTKNKCSVNNNCDENTEIHSSLGAKYFTDDIKKFNIITTTRNISSGTQLTYKVYDVNNNDVTELFNISNNYVVKNSNTATMEAKDILPIGKYYLHTSSNANTNIIEFNIVDVVELELNVPEPIFSTDKTAKINAIINTTEGTSNYRWTSSDENIATVDNDGNLTILGSGMFEVTLTIDTYYGTVSDTKEVYIYEKIYTIEDFFEQLSNKYSVSYLMNDLDFEGINFYDYVTEDEFSGVFNGGFHTLKNIKKINKNSNEEVGLFKYADSAIIKNFKIVDSEFSGSGSTGAVAGFAHYSIISNVYNYATIFSEYSAGGIVGEGYYNEIDGCYNKGNITAIAPTHYSYGGGIVGSSFEDRVENSYNEGIIYSETKWNRTGNYTAQSRAGGIIGDNYESYITNSYNVGKVSAYSAIQKNLIYSNGLNTFYNISNVSIDRFVTNSYYLKDDSYTELYAQYEKTIEELKTASTFNEWDFKNVWYIRENKITPILRNYPIEAEQMEFNIFSNILNNNYIYNYEYEVLPYTVSSDVLVRSEDEDLFTIENNKIITKNKTGTANIVFKVGNKEFKYPITVKPIIEYSYGKGVTSEEIEVDLNINYYNEYTDNSYLKLIYKVGNDTNIKEFNYGIMENKFTFKIDNNNDIKLELYICNEECDLIAEESFKIDNIDKEKPEITIESDNTKSTLKINVRDIGISGLSKDNKYEYAISNSNVLAPMVFNTYTPNKVMNNIFMNHYMKYLWVKNISDNVGNKASLNDYIIYNLDIKNVDAEEVVVDIFSDILNYNKEYTFDYEVTPINITNDVIIESSNKELFEIKDNKIITKEKNGTANILFKIGKKEFKYPIIIKDSLEYAYDKNLTNRDISVKIHTNYFEGVLDEFEHLKLIYKIGEKEYVKEFDKNIAINEYEFVVNNNNNINLELYLCNEDCILVNNKNFDIKNIDKEKPIINYVADNINGTLQINIKDIGVSGLNEKNIYKYAISNSDTRTPITSFKEYIPNTEMNNITMNKEYKYLWLYNIGDKVGNKVMDDDYIVYTIDLQAIYYNINYYNNDKSTLLKSEKIKEDDRVIINYKPNNYEDENYIYEFDYWDGFKEGMIATSNINLYAVYKKIPKELHSDLYTIKDGIIKNIKLNDINKEYSVDLFKSNLKYYESYSFYENNNAYITDVKNIKTGMKLKNNLYEYIIVLAGDVTGDGKVKMNDVMKIANHLVNKNVLNDEYLLAGDVTNDDNVKMNDVMKIASSLVNGGSL